MYEKRFYRELLNNDLYTFSVCVGETDLSISCDHNLEKQAYGAIIKARKIISDYSSKNKMFQSSLIPLKDGSVNEPLITQMLKAGQIANVGPFASVAGAIAEYVGKSLVKYCKNVIIENGGDIYLQSTTERTIGIYAGDSPLTGKITIKIKKEDYPIGVCTSSGTVGHSLSFGKADAVVVLSKDTALADAVATATCNMIKTKEDIILAIEKAYNIDGIIGVLAIMGDQLGVIGEIELV